VFVAALATLALIGFVAALLPARRAAAVDPLRSLRES
jgi:ABC-type antimicrobial peptide transport system permease subunit